MNVNELGFFEYQPMLMNTYQWRLCNKPSKVKPSRVRGAKRFPLQAVSLLLWEIKPNLLLHWSCSCLNRTTSLLYRSTLSSPLCSQWSSFLCSTPSSPTSSWSCSSRLPRKTRSAPSVGSRRCSACPWSPTACKPWSTAWGSYVSTVIFWHGTGYRCQSKYSLKSNRLKLINTFILNLF